MINETWTCPICKITRKENDWCSLSGCPGLTPSRRSGGMIDEEMMRHLNHMAEVRPDGLDRSAAVWAIAEIQRLRIMLRVMTEQVDRIGEQA